MIKNYVSIDLGTENLVIYSSNRGIVFNEPSVMAYDIKKKSLVALGNDAYSLIGKEHKNIRLVRPISDGVISDLKATQELLKAIFEKIKLFKIWKNAIVLLAAPSSVTELEHNSLKEMASKLGAKSVFIEEEIKMAAVGAGINISNPEGNLVVDIGGGTTDCAVLSSGDIAVSSSIKVAGRHMTTEIQKYLRARHNIIIGEKTGETLKRTLGTLHKDASEVYLEVYGRGMVDGMPKQIRVNNSEIREILLPFFNNIADLIAEVLEKTDPELVGDIFRNGIYFCGGGALIPGIEKHFKALFNIPVNIANNPLLCVIEGTKSWENSIREEIEFQGRNRRFG